MTDLLRFALLGLGSGAIYALAAQGIVVIYRGSGVLNFAQGAVGLVSAALFVNVWYDRGWPLWPSVLLATAAAGLVGALVYLLVMRWLQDRSQLVRLVASLGVLTVLQEGVIIVFGDDIVLPPAFLPSGQLEITDTITIGYDRLVILGTAIVVSALLAFYFRSTRLGMATQATNDDPVAAAALGWSPVVIGCVNWTIGCALGGLAGVFIVAITGLSPIPLTLVILPAFAAALASGFRSFGLTLLYGVLLGMGQALLVRYSTDIFTPIPGLDPDGWSEALPFLVIVVVLVWRGSVIPRRGELSALLPRVGFPRRVGLPAVITTAVLVTAIFVTPFDLMTALVASLLVAIVGLSVVVLTGFAGQLSLGQMAIAGVGALVAGRLNQELGWPFLVVAPLGVVAAVGVGVLFALPSLRSRGVTLAVVTLGLGVAVEKVVFANSSYIGGVNGTEVEPPELFGWSFASARYPERYAVVVAVVFVLAGVIVANVRRGKIGRRFLAVRSNENAAASLGISVPFTKMAAFGLGAAIAALGGVLIAFRFGFVQYESFSLFASLQVVMFTVIGGTGYVIGAGLGSILAPGGIGFWIGHQLVDDTTSWLALIAGVLLLLTLVIHPDGQAELITRKLERFRRKRRAGRPATAATTVPDDVDAVPVTPRPLVVEGLSVSFGGVRVLDDVSLSVEPGRIVGLIGANGAGKTTLLEAISGYVHPAAGTVRVGDETVTGASAVRLARTGMRRSFQGVESFDDLSVSENLLVAHERLRARSWLRELVRPSKPVLPVSLARLASDFGLTDDLDKPPNELAFGRRRLLGVARALAGHPTILLLDEPASGLSADETQELAGLVRTVVDTFGIGVLLVEHDVDMVLGLCDEVVVLDVGRVIFRGAPEQVLADAGVRAAYLGERDDDTEGPAATEPGTTVAVHAAANAEHETSGDV